MRASRRRVRFGIDRRRLQLLKLGVDMFGTRSYDDVSIDAIAAAAGISKGLLYHYFPTKRAFYVEAVRAAAVQLRDLVEPNPRLPPVQRLAAALDAYLRYVEEHAVAYSGLMRGGLAADREIRSIVEATRRVLINRMLRALAIKRAPATLRVALRGWLGYIEAASLDWLARRDIDRSALIQMLVLAAAAALLAARQTDPRLHLGIEPHVLAAYLQGGERVSSDAVR